MSEHKTTNGQICIADEVIEVIAVTAALEVEGVTDSAGTVKGLVKKGHTKCVQITREDQELILDLEIVVNFGAKVQLVAKQVQQKVKNAVETMTGLEVPSVNVTVTGIVKEKCIKTEE